MKERKKGKPNKEKNEKTFQATLFLSKLF